MVFKRFIASLHWRDSNGVNNSDIGRMAERSVTSMLDIHIRNLKEI